MKIIGILIIGCSLFLQVSPAWASRGLILHAAELSVAKFHRYDNSIHPYGGKSAWFPYILPNGAETDRPLTVENPDHSVSIFFSTLDDLIASVIEVASRKHTLIQVLNIHAHGVPGGQWFPANESFRQSVECYSWKSAVSGSDQALYDQYYSPFSASDIEALRQASATPTYHGTCLTGLWEWKREVDKFPAFRSVFAPDAQIRFLSCLVGLGEAGRVFSEGLAALVLPPGSGHVESATAYGLGDWSLPEGMGFWDLQNEPQLEHDNALYVADRKDREIFQEGTIRLVGYTGTAWESVFLKQRKFMDLSFETKLPGKQASQGVELKASRQPFSGRIRIPGTKAFADIGSYRETSFTE